MSEHIIYFIKNVWNILLNSLLGGWDSAFEILLIIITLDYITGLANAFKKKEVNSRIGYMGIMKKISIFIVIILSAQMDRIVGDENHLFRNCTSFFFSANEAISVLENVGQLGIKLPSFLKNSFVNLKDTCDSSTSKIDKTIINKH